MLLTKRELEEITSAALSDAVKADIRRRMSPPAWQSVARISEETGTHICTLSAWRKGWRLQGEASSPRQASPRSRNASSSGPSRRRHSACAVLAIDLKPCSS